MIPQALRTAGITLKKYKTRDPFEIIDARGILVKCYDKPESLLGFFTVMNRKQIIGMNNAADEIQFLTGVIHELGHSLNDYKDAASGGRFEDYRFFSLSNAPREYNANLTGAELYIEDDYILERICYEQYCRVIAYIKKHIERYTTDRDKAIFKAEQMQEFYELHQDIPSYGQFASELGVDAGVVKFKFRALRCKGYDLPSPPDSRGDFLRNWRYGMS